MLNSYSHCAIL